MGNAHGALDLQNVMSATANKRLQDFRAKTSNAPLLKCQLITMAGFFLRALQRESSEFAARTSNVPPCDTTGAVNFQQHP